MGGCHEINSKNAENTNQYAKNRAQNPGPESRRYYPADEPFGLWQAAETFRISGSV